MSVVDKRLNLIEGKLSSASEIDETFRSICAHFGQNLTKMRTFTKSQKVINIKGLVLLAIEMNAEIKIDAAMDTFSVRYADREDVPIENKEVEEIDDDSEDEFESVTSNNESEEESEENNDGELF